MLALWTWIAVAVLIVIPPAVFTLFLRDATRLLREMAPPDSKRDDPENGSGEVA